MTRIQFKFFSATLFVALAALPLSAATKVQTAKLMTFQDTQDTFVAPEEIEGSIAALVRHDSGVKINVRTRDLPAGAYTNWVVVFNHPDECMDFCDFPDVFNPAVAGSIFWGAGGIVNGTGEANFQADIAVGVPPAGAGQLLVGNGLLNAHGAEIHYILKTHGPVQDDPEVLFRQVSSIGGACFDLPGPVEHPEDPDEAFRIYPCWDPQFVAFPAAD